MKIIVTGSLGHISKPLSKALLQKGHSVTVISSKADRQIDIEVLGATAAIGTVEDADFLTAAFMGADAVYTMLPPPDFSNPGLDLMAHTHKITNNYAHAIAASGVKRVVHLSSIGAHLAKDAGLILLHHQAERILNKLPGVAITFMRPVAFYYNLYSFIPAIKSNGVIASNYGEDDRIAWVSPIDIAAAIADELEISPVDRKVRYVASDEPSCNEIVAVLGEAIGKPDLKWNLISDEQLQAGLESFGVSKQIAAGLVEMNASMHRGQLFEDYNLNKPAILGNVKLKDFAKEFAAAFSS
jgi:uncharacterized protein YbjT (DUF2867 family)